MYNTHEEIFTVAVKALAARNWTRSASATELEQCLYGGIGCAIGVLNGVEKFATNWEDPEGSPDIGGIYKDRISEFRQIFDSSIKLNFLTDLQRSHDGGTNPDQMKRYFSDTAEKWDLQISQEIRDLLD